MNSLRHTIRAFYREVPVLYVTIVIVVIIVIGVIVLDLIRGQPMTILQALQASAEIAQKTCTIIGYFQ